jgi:hypothetical protein
MEAARAFASPQPDPKTLTRKRLLRDVIRRAQACIPGQVRRDMEVGKERGKQDASPSRTRD